CNHGNCSGVSLWSFLILFVTLPLRIPFSASSSKIASVVNMLWPAIPKWLRSDLGYWGSLVLVLQTRAQLHFRPGLPCATRTNASKQNKNLPHAHHAAPLDR